MSRIDTLLERAGSEFRSGAAHLPDAAWKTGSNRSRIGMGVAMTAGLAVLVLFVPLALWWGSGDGLPVGGESPVLQAPADIVFEGDGWVLGFHDEPISGEHGFDFCWEFQAVGRGPDGSDVSESGCDQRGSFEDGSSAMYTGPRFDLEDARVWVVEVRPGEGGEIEARTGRTSTLYDGQRMPLSRADIFVFEDPRDTPHNGLTLIPPYQWGDVVIRRVPIPRITVEAAANFLGTFDARKGALMEILEADSNTVSVDDVSIQEEVEGDPNSVWMQVDTTSRPFENHKQHDGAWETIQSLAALYAEPDGAWYSEAWIPNLRFTYNGKVSECSGEFMVALADSKKFRTDWDAACRPDFAPDSPGTSPQLPAGIAVGLDPSALAVLNGSGRTLARSVSRTLDGFRLESATFSNGRGLVELIWRDWPEAVDLHSVLGEDTTVEEVDGLEVTIREHPEDNMIEVGVFDGALYASVYTTFTDDLDLATVRELAFMLYAGLNSDESGLGD